MLVVRAALINMRFRLSLICDASQYALPWIPARGTTDALRLEDASQSHFFPAAENIGVVITFKKRKNYAGFLGHSDDLRHVFLRRGNQFSKHAFHGLKFFEEEEVTQAVDFELELNGSLLELVVSFLFQRGRHLCTWY